MEEGRNYKGEFGKKYRLLLMAAPKKGGGDIKKEEGEERGTQCDSFFLPVPLVSLSLSPFQFYLASSEKGV